MGPPGAKHVVGTPRNGVAAATRPLELLSFWGSSSLLNEYLSTKLTLILKACSVFLGHRSSLPNSTLQQCAN